MARVITIASNKGGTGKTTTAVNFSAALRAKGYDVLIIDYDGQANVTDTLRVDTSGGTTYDAMKERATPFINPVRVLPQGKGCGVLDVLPSCSDLSALDVELGNEPDRLTRFTDIVAKYRTWYDVVIIDTAPVLGLLTLSALYAADELITTVQPEYLAVKGLLTINETVEALNNNRQSSGFPGIKVLFTQYDRRKSLHRMTAEQVEAAGFQVFGTRIRENVALGEAPAAGLDIYRYNPNSNGAADYRAFTTEYLNGVKLNHVAHKYGK